MQKLTTMVACARCVNFEPRVYGGYVDDSTGKCKVNGRGEMGYVSHPCNDGYSRIVED